MTPAELRALEAAATPGPWKPETKKATILKRVLVGVHLEAEPPSHVGQYARSAESRAKALRAWVRDFEDFIRDHRSADPVYLSVVEDRKDLCSACNEDPEAYTEDGITICACCGAELEMEGKP